MIRFLVFSAVIASGIFAWNMWAPPQYHSAFLWYIFIGFVIASAFINFILAKAGAKGPQHFVRTFMAVTAIKMFAVIAIALVYSILNRATAFPFILSFLVLYLVFTVYEVGILMKRPTK
jgi:hypothetical protein